MRGVELPVNAIIIIALAIIALIAIIAFFYPEFFGQSESVSLESAKNAACMEMLNADCKLLPVEIGTPYFDSDQDGSINDVHPGGMYVLCGLSGVHGGDNLYQLFFCWYGISYHHDFDREVREMKKLCGCPAT